MIKSCVVLFSAVLAITTLSSKAVTYTNTSGYSNTVSHSKTKSHNVTIRTGYQKITSKDTSFGGLDITGKCDPLTCSPSDNVTKGTTTKITKTNLKIKDVGESVTTSTLASCFSGSDMNGLSHQESHSHESFATTGWNKTTATGKIKTTTINKTKTTNGGLEVGKSYEKLVDLTKINEKTKTTFSTTGERITFTSSVGN